MKATKYRFEFGRSLQKLSAAETIDKFGCKMYQKKHLYMNYKLYWVIFQKYFVHREQQVLKMSMFVTTL